MKRWIWMIVLLVGVGAGVRYLPSLYQSLLDQRARRLFSVVEKQIPQAEKCFQKFFISGQLTEACRKATRRSRKDVSYEAKHLKDPIFFWMRQFQYLEAIGRKYSSTKWAAQAHLLTSYLYCKSVPYQKERKEDDLKQSIHYYELAQKKGFSILGRSREGKESYRQAVQECLKQYVPRYAFSK